MELVELRKPVSGLPSFSRDDRCSTRRFVSCDLLARGFKSRLEMSKRGALNTRQRPSCFFAAPSSSTSQTECNEAFEDSKQAIADRAMGRIFVCK